MRPDGEPAAVGEALRSPVLIRYQPRYRENDAPRGPTGPARARGRGDRIRPLAAAHESESGPKQRFGDVGYSAAVRG
jgi:hypothetical protein